MPHVPSSRHVRRKLQRSFLLSKTMSCRRGGSPLSLQTRKSPATSRRTASPSHQEALQAAPLSSRANEQLITWQRRAAREMSMILSDSDLALAFKFPALQVALTPRSGHTAARVVSSALPTADDFRISSAFSFFASCRAACAPRAYSQPDCCRANGRWHVCAATLEPGLPATSVSLL